MRESSRKRSQIEIGNEFGRLKVTSKSYGTDGKAIYECQCKCGNVVHLSVSHLKKAYSCGCMSSDYLPDSGIKAESFTHLGKKTKRNTSGCVGVSWIRSKEKWRATIRFAGKDKHLGYFDDLNDAIKARKEAENDIYSEYSDFILNSPNTNNSFSDLNN